MAARGEAAESAGWDYSRPAESWEEMRQLTPDFGGIDYGRLEREGGTFWLRYFDQRFPVAPTWPH